jgi:hypothetical protein
MSDDEYNKEVFTHIAATDSTYNSIAAGGHASYQTPPPSPGWGASIAGWAKRTFAGSIGENAKAAASAAGGTAVDVAKDAARGVTQAGDAISNAVVGTGKQIADKTGLGPAVVGDQAWHDYMAAPTSHTNPIQFGDDRRDEMFGAAPKGMANGLLTGIADFVATDAATAGIGGLAKGGKLAELFGGLPSAVRAALKVGGVQTLGTDPRAQRLSTLASNTPVFGPAIAAIATKPDDSEAVAYGKSLFENIATAAMFDGLVAGVRGLRGAPAEGAVNPASIPTDKPDVVNVVDRGNGQAELQPKNEPAAPAAPAAAPAPEPAKPAGPEQSLREPMKPEEFQGRVDPKVHDFVDEFRTSGESSPESQTSTHNENTSITLHPQGGNTVVVKDLSRVSGEPGSGGPGTTMRQLTALADQHGVNLKLQASPYGENAMQPEELRNFYRKFGFEQTKVGSAEMVRRPSDVDNGFRESGTVGTPAEHADVTANPVGPRADIEALGASTNEAASQHGMEPGTLTDLQKQKVVEIGNKLADSKDPADIDRLAKGTVFNFNYVHGVEGAKSYLEAMADVLDKTGEPTRSGMEAQTHAETQQIAEGLFGGVPADKAVASIAKGLAGSTAGLRAKVVAARMGIYALGQQIKGLSIAADEFPHNSLAMENLSRALDTFFDVHEHLSGSTTEIAGALEAHKIPVGGLAQNLDGADGVAGADGQAADAATRSSAVAEVDAANGKKPEAAGPSTPNLQSANASLSKAEEYVKAKRPEGESKSAPVTPQEYRDLARSIRLSDGDPDAIIAAIRSTKRIAQAGVQEQDPTTMQKIIRAATSYRLAAMLSGPKTAATIVFNQATTALQMPIERMWAGVRSGSPELRQQGWDQLVGNFQGISESLSAAKQAWDIGNNVLDPQAHSLDTGPMPLGSTWMGRLANVPSRFHIAANEFFKQQNYRSAVRALSLRASNEVGADAAQTASRLQGDMRYAYDLNGGAVNPVALEYSRTATFTNPLGDDTIGGKLQNMASAHPMVKFVVPFIRTPTNIFRYAWQRTPILGAFQKTTAADLAAGGERAAVANAKMELGTALYGAAAYWAISGRVTGKGPTDPELRAQWIAAGNQPYSFKFGNAQISYRRADPLMAPVGLVTDGVNGVGKISQDLKERLHQDRVDDDGIYHPAVSFMERVADFAHASGHLMSDEGTQVASSLIASVGQNLSSKTYMQGVTEFMDAFSNGDQHKVQALMKGEAGTFVPNILAQMNPDKTVHETRSIISSLMARVPGVSNTLEPKRNIFGEKIMYPAGYMDYANKALNPFTAMVHDPKIDDDLISLGKGMAMPAEKITANDGVNQIDLTDRDMWKEKDTPNRQSPYDRLLELMGKPTDGGPSLREDMTDLIQSSDWTDADPSVAPGGERYVMAQKLIQEHYRDALDQVKDEYPRLSDAIDGIHSLKSISRHGAQDDIDAAFAAFRAAHR